MIITEILTTLSQFIISVIENSQYAGIVFLMTLESACIPIPSEIIMPFSGYLAAAGKLKFWWVVLAGSVGNLIGSLIAYWVGKYGGRPLVAKWGKYIFILKSDLDRADRFFKKYGASSIFISRLLPIVRTFISLPAGIAKMDLSRFIIFTFLGAIPFNAALTYIGFTLGENWDLIKESFRGLDLVIGIIIIAAIIFWIARHIILTKKENGNSNI